MERAVHRTQDTYALSHFRQRTSEHLKRIRDGRVEIITQNGEAAMVVMSPERYDFLIHSVERGHLWREALRAYKQATEAFPRSRPSNAWPMNSTWIIDALRRGNPCALRHEARPLSFR